MSSLPGDLDPKSLRASDRDRERTAEILRDAAGDGRLQLDELDERLSEVYAAKTHAELEPIVADLRHPGTPDASSPAAGSAAPGRFGGEPASRGAAAIMGAFERKGGWVVPARFRAFAMMGGGELDLREARFAERTVTIRAFVLMGGISIIVPEDADVQIGGLGLLGAFEHDAAGPGDPAGPRIVIKGLSLFGGVGVKRKPAPSRARGTLRSADTPGLAAPPGQASVGEM